MVERLSERSRYLRFAAPKPRLTSRELDLLIDVDHHRNEALVALDPDTGRGIAIVRWVAAPGEPGVAEIAVTVADEWQGAGSGRRCSHGSSTSRGPRASRSCGRRSWRSTPARSRCCGTPASAPVR